VTCVTKMDRQKFEQRCAIKFCVKLGESATVAYEQLQRAYGEHSLSREQVFRWHKSFLEGREQVEDEPRAGRPSNSNLVLCPLGTSVKLVQTTGTGASGSFKLAATKTEKAAVSTARVQGQAGALSGPKKKEHAPKPKVKSPRLAAVKNLEKKKRPSPAKPNKLPPKAENTGKVPTKNRWHHELRPH
jgi:hypothetical protein